MHIAFSTCPNDTFMFDAMVHDRLDQPIEDLQLSMADILHLNHMAMADEADVVKISYNTFGHIRDRYVLLDAGSALGHDCGPLLIVKDDITVEDLIRDKLPVAIPGKHTTANLLLGFFAPEITHKEEMLFHEVMPAVLSGKAAAGLIIHENRFTYQQMGLRCLQDLGSYWEEKTGLPIPLGAIVAHQRLGKEKIQAINRLMRASVQWAFEHQEDTMPFVKAHAQEMEPSVMKAHIDLYVNEYSLDLGPKGLEAIHTLLATGKAMGLYPNDAPIRLASKL